ncbi:ribonuclease H protein, partial [Tanacetum coccineum]
IIVEHSTGSVMLCSGETYSTSSPLMAELLAICIVRRLALTYGWQNAIVELDSKVAISVASIEVDHPWALAAFIVGI